MSQDQVEIALLKQTITRHEEEIASLKDHVGTMEAGIADRERQRDKEEKNRLLAGISFMGAVLLTTLGVVWSYRGVIFKG